MSYVQVRQTLLLLESRTLSFFPIVEEYYPPPGLPCAEDDTRIAIPCREIKIGLRIPRTEIITLASTYKAFSSFPLPPPFPLPGSLEDEELRSSPVIYPLR